MRKINFGYVVLNSNRRIVIHHTYCFNDILSYLKYNDLVFFDDCLYSLYVFIKNNIEFLIQNNIYCIIGFSANIYRRNGKPIYDANCAEYHAKIHNNDITAFNAYMSIDEIKELLLYNNIYIACHGYNHLDLLNMNISKLKIMNYFILDLKNAIKKYKEFDLNTNIYVYPYTYDQFPLANKILKDNGFYYIFAGLNSKRILIEDIIKGTECNYNSI